MTDPPHPDAHGDIRNENTEKAGGSTTGPPRWVKVFGIIGLVLVALILISLLTGHGPGRHMTGGLGGPATPVTQPSAVEAGARSGGPVLLRVGAAW
ncbi:hypothetical protein [Pseudonocardia sp. GCM10023141]|uniref:hypothetical protein n=1 Tax=Pseudonocardia sp. GCM10023141 TaxID=3252653 RepID=UPI00360933BE